MLPDFPQWLLSSTDAQVVSSFRSVRMKFVAAQGLCGNCTCVARLCMCGLESEAIIVMGPRQWQRKQAQQHSHNMDCLNASNLQIVLELEETRKLKSYHLKITSRQQRWDAGERRPLCHSLCLGNIVFSSMDNNNPTSLPPILKLPCLTHWLHSRSHAADFAGWF